MKKIIDSFTSFTRPERAGLVILSAILLILVAIRTTMSLWVRPVTDKQKEAELVKAWSDYKSAHEPNKLKINLYTADSIKLLSIKGIGNGRAHDILECRRQHKLTSIESLYTIVPDQQWVNDLSEFAYVDTNEKSD
jgi:hypothetical protein